MSGDYGVKGIPDEVCADAVRDLIALVTAVREEDYKGWAAVALNADREMCLAFAERLLVRLCDERGLTPGEWAEWAFENCQSPGLSSGYDRSRGWHGPLRGRGRPAGVRR